jgi:hypothetical protein
MPNTATETAARLQQLCALSDKAVSIFLANEGTPKGEKAERLSALAINRCQPLAEAIWERPVRSWSDVLDRALVLECFHCEESTSANQDRAICELIAAVKIMGGLA